MPELPDLTVFAESLDKAVLGRKISDAQYHRTKRINVDPKAFCDSLRGQKITGIKRVGKALLFELASGDKFLVHLMLSGGFKMSQKNEDVPSAILTVTFEDEKSMVLFDPRGLTTVTVNPDLHRTAVDALEVTREYLEKKFKEKQTITIKEFLTDQDIIAGIGNAYSDEILWQAKIAPASIVGKIPEKAMPQLVTAIHQVLKAATDSLRKTNPGMMSGEVRDHLAVHKPKAKLSPTGSAIMTRQIASKKSYYTEEQILYE